MRGHPFRIQPWADQATRRQAVLEIRRLIEAGRYHVPAGEVADALLFEVVFEDPDSSSCGGLDADAN